MHNAAESGQLEVIKFLSPMVGARVHKRDSRGFNILQWAAFNGHCQVVRYLIEELKFDSKDYGSVCEALERSCVQSVASVYMLIVANTSMCGRIK